MIGPERCQILVGLVPILLLALGGMHLHDCPKEPMIPIYVIVGSCFLLFIQLTLLCGCGKLCAIPIALFLVFLFSWFIAGSVFIYRAFQPNFESKRSPEYCEKILYQAAFWCNNLGWVLMVFLAISAFCRCLYRVFIEKEPRKGSESDIEEGNSEGDDIEKQGDQSDKGDVEKQGDQSDKGDVEKQGDEGGKGDVERQGDEGGKGDVEKQGDQSDKGDVEKQGDEGGKGDVERQGDEGGKGENKVDEERGLLDKN